MGVWLGRVQEGDGIGQVVSSQMKLTSLPQKMAELGYQEEHLQQLLGISDLPLMTPLDVPSYLWRCREADSALALMACLWLLQVKTEADQVRSYLGTELVEKLMERGYLKLEGACLRAEVELYPCLGLQVFTDQHLGKGFAPQHVYELGTDSYVLARVTPRPTGQRALDLCTGSGVHALDSARHYPEVVGVDLNPRALDFARFNAEVNGLEGVCRFVQGDLYEPVEKDDFDLITANPPFVPTPDEEMELHRTGGEDGERVSRRLVAGLPRHLRVGGLFSMVLDYPIKKDSSYLDRLNSWLAGREVRGEPLPGWGVAVLLFGVDSREEYIKAHIDGSNPEQYLRDYEAHLECYQRHAIEEVAFGNVFILRLEPEHPGFTCVRRVSLPKVWVADRVEGWLQALRLTRDPQAQWDKARPRLTERVKDLWLNTARDRGRIELEASEWWSVPREVHGLTVELARQLKGRKTVRQLAEGWARRHKVDGDTAYQDVLVRLGWMAENLVCRFD